MPYQHSTYGCPVEATLNIVEGKWKVQILYALSHSTKRFGALQRALPHITRQVLATQLRELERDGIVHRTIFAEVPPRVEYSLTSSGKSLEPVLTHLLNWGTQYIDQQSNQENENQDRA